MKNTRSYGGNKMQVIEQLRSVVTHFSEEIKFRACPKDEVTVAGRITDVHKIDDEYYMMTLDDYIGETRVLFSARLYNHYQSIIEVGSFVSVDGYVNAVTRKVGDRKETQYSVVAYDMKLLVIGE
jgi:hypothetical protein